MKAAKRIILFSAASASVYYFRLDFIEALTLGGNKVVVVAPGAERLHLAAIEQAGAEYHGCDLQRTGVSVFADMVVIWRLRNLWRRVAPDVIIAYGHKPILYSLFTCPPKKGITVWAMLCGLGYAFTGNTWKQRSIRTILRCVYPFALQRARGVFLLNSDDSVTLQDAGVLSRKVPVWVLPGEGVRVDKFSAFALRGDVTRFLLIARLLADKGIREYVAAARVIKAQRPTVEFHLVGPTDPNPAAIPLAEVEGWQREGVIIYHGSQSDVRRFLRECTVYVLPSYREGTPRTVLEAMATGRAVITTDAPGCRETVFFEKSETLKPETRKTNIKQGRNGFLVPVKSVEALVVAMRRFIDEPELAVRMGKEGRRLAEEYYDVHKVNQQILEFMGLAPKSGRDGEAVGR